MSRTDRRREQDDQARDDARVMNARHNEPPPTDRQDFCPASKFGIHRFVPYGGVHCEFCGRPPDPR